HVLLCGQVPWDASVDHIDYLSWLEHTASELLTLSQRPVVFRAHPMASLPPPPGCRGSFGSLTKDLEKAHALVSFNSNTGVDAFLNGVPAFAFDEGAMTWGLCNR